MGLKEMLGGKRGSLVLLHPTSLPEPESGPYGVGELGSAAFGFVDELAAAGVLAWQTLPLGHTGFADSPYQTFSRVAGSPHIISIEKLRDCGDLTPQEHDEYVNRVRQAGLDPGRTDYGWLFYNKLGSSWADGHAALRIAFSRFDSLSEADSRRIAFNDFRRRERRWLDDYAEYMAIKEHHNHRPWSEWEPELRHARTWRSNRDPLTERMEGLERTIRFYHYLQFAFFEQWQALREYAAKRNRIVIGDIPWYVGYDSADVWANPEVFCLDPEGAPLVVAGVPPDYFAPTGQLWGNPIYDWSNPATIDWWVATLDRLLTMVDLIRIDHFRALDTYWQISHDWALNEGTAQNGEWAKGPGPGLLDAVRERLESTGRIPVQGQLPIIAEDLGFLDPLYPRVEDYPHEWNDTARYPVTPQFARMMLSSAADLGTALDPTSREYSTRRGVDVLLERFGLPWMGVLQFGFQGSDRFLPVGLEPDSVIYTGTHDNDTSLGWYLEQAEKEDPETTDPLGVRIWRAMMRARDMRQLEVDANDQEVRDVSWEMMEVAWSAPSDLAGAPMQDLLCLDSSGRMNLPGDSSGWWQWRARAEQIDWSGIRERLIRLNEVYDRYA